MTPDPDYIRTWVRRIRAAARSGKPISIARGKSNEHLDKLNELSDSPGREIPAVAIREALADRDLNAHPQGLRLRGAFVVGVLDFSYAQLPCRLEINFSRFEESPIFFESKLLELELASTWLPGLNLYHASLAGNAEFARLTSLGEIDATDMRIEGRLDLESSTIRNPSGNALGLSGAIITGNANFEKADVTGRIYATGASIGGQLDFSDARLCNLGTTALSLDGARIEGGLYMERTHSQGEVRALSAYIVNLDCTDAVFENPGADALSLDMVELPRGARLDNARVSGAFRMMDCTVASIDLDETLFDNPGEDALVLDGATVNGRLSLANAAIMGSFRAVGAKVTSLVNLSGSTFDTAFASTPAIQLQQASFNSLDLESVRCLGTMDLSFATIQTLRVAAQVRAIDLPPLKSAQGWSIGSISGALRTDRRLARDWLDTIALATADKRNFGTQPWQEMARVHSQMGQPDHGRWLLFQAARRTTRASSWFAKPVRWAYAGLVGYGFYPFLAALWLLATFGLALGFASSNASAFTPSDAAAAYELDANGNVTQTPVTGSSMPQPPGYPKFTPWLLAIDTTLPAASTGQAQAWRVADSAWLYGAFAALKTFSWMLVALTLAAITGLLRKG